MNELYKYVWDKETGGVLLLPDQEKMSMEARPVYYQELDLLGFDKYYDYPRDDESPIMWAINNKYYYCGEQIAKTNGGSLFTKPELEVLDNVESEKKKLKCINVELMVDKNKTILESIVHETLKNIYNRYNDYYKKLDTLYVAFSGGKDSIVITDLVQRCLPHDDFKVVFGNTDMELPTTLEYVSEVKNGFMKKGIDFIIAKSHFKSEDSWKAFGPPSRRLRWCCSVHKSVPVLNELHKIFGDNRLRTMMITGVRGDESSARAAYDEFSLGKKIAGQYSFHPILDWSSVEVFLYIFLRKLPLNRAYKLGLNRVGCLVCPNSSAKHEFLKYHYFKNEVQKYLDIIKETSKKDLQDGRGKIFLETGGWKMRVSGRELKFNDEKFVATEEKKGFRITLHNNDDKWLEWYKTIGEYVALGDSKYKLEYKDVWREASVQYTNDAAEIFIENDVRSKNSIEFFSLFKIIIIKSLYCVGCKLCEAECSQRNISINGSNVKIKDECSKCKSCLKIMDGCIYYNSVKDSGGVKMIKGINRYLSIGVSGDWIREYFADDTYEPGNRKTDVMFGFLRDAEVLKKRNVTAFGKRIKEMDLNQETPWALMLCNLVYTPAFGWFVKNIPMNQRYTEVFLSDDLGDDTTQKAKSEFWNGFKIILNTMPYGNSMNFAYPEIEEKMLKNGNVQYKMHSLTRGAWPNPIPEVILYSLYKFAEACDGMYQFSLESLLDDTIERGGISPTRIFGLDRETMIPILNGLSANYPAFISATFTLDLDQITLRSEKKAEDVLELL